MPGDNTAHIVDSNVKDALFILVISATFLIAGIWAMMQNKGIVGSLIGVAFVGMSIVCSYVAKKELT